MIKYIDNCVGCPPEIGCLGSACPYVHIPVLVCDECKNDDLDELYEYDGEQLCLECLLKNFKKITVDNLSEYIDKGCDF